jgi:hypothetical protein
MFGGARKVGDFVHARVGGFIHRSTYVTAAAKGYEVFSLSLSVARHEVDRAMPETRTSGDDKGGGDVDVKVGGMARRHGRRIASPAGSM